MVLAEVTGPLLSFSASGSLDDAVTFRRARGQNLARAFASPRDVPTPAQLTQRARVAGSVTLWHAFRLLSNAADRAGWQLRGDLVSPMSAYNAFSRFYLERASAGQTLTTSFYNGAPTNTSHLAFRFAALNTTLTADAMGAYYGDSPFRMRLFGTENYGAGGGVLHTMNTGLPAKAFFYVQFINNVRHEISPLYKVKLT